MADANPFAIYTAPAPDNPFVQHVQPHEEHGWAMPSLSGLVKNLAAGTIEGATGALTSVSDPGAGDELGALGIEPKVKMGTPAQAQHAMHGGLGVVGLNPENVKVEGGGDQLVREAGRFVPAAFGGEASLIQRLARVAGPAAGAAAGKEVGGPIGEAVGALAGGGLTAGAEAAYGAGKAMADLRNMSPGDRAQELLMRALEERDHTPADVADQSLAQFGDKPVTVMDVGGPATARLARTVATLPGEGSSKLVNFLAERQADQNGRVIRDIQNNLADGSDVFEVAKQLGTERAQNAKPLYDKAMAGGSIAPLEDQLRSELAAATGAKGTIAREMKKIEESNPGALVARGAVGADIRAHYVGLHQQLLKAESDRQAVLGMFQQAKSDASSDAPGAVWSPRIQEFLDSPEVRTGLKHGLMIQRREALAAGERFDPTEYGVTGIDEAGDPIVSKVPNMRLLDAGKKGLDAQLEEFRDKTSGRLNLTEAGRALERVRKAYVGELDRLNPDYKAARDAWAGPSQSLDAVALGKSFTNLQPEELATNLARMTDDQKNFFRIGAARTLQDMINGSSDNRDAVARIFGNQTIRDQIESVFGKRAATAMAEQMTPEKMMTATHRFVTGGSNTVNKAADIADTAGATEKAVRGFATGGVKGAIAGVADIPARITALFNQMTPETRDELANLLMRTQPISSRGIINRPPLAVDNRGISGLLPLLSAGALGRFAPTPLDETGANAR